MDPDALEARWDDYLFEDEELPRPESFAPQWGESKVEKIRWHSKEDENRIALRIALQSISNASTTPIE